MKLTPSTVDILLSTLDQQSPTTGKPIGRLTDLVNAKVTKYQNPRAADGTVTHVRVEKRDGFKTTTNVVRNSIGVSVGTLGGVPQLLFGGGDALREVANNRLYTKSDSWVRATDATGAEAVVFPQIVRSTSVYAANSQAEAPDIALGGTVECLAWREVANQDMGNGDRSTPAASALDGVRVMFRDLDGTTLRQAFTNDPEGLGTTDYKKSKVFYSDGVFWVLQDFVTAGNTVQIDVTAFDANGAELGVFMIGAVTHNVHWDAAVIPGVGVVVAMPNNATGVKFTALTYSGTIIATTNVDASITTDGGSLCAWLTDTSGTNLTGYLVVGTGAGGAAGTLTPYRIVSLAQDHVYPVAASGLDLVNLWISGVTGYKDPLSTNLIVAYTLMDLFGLPEWTTYGGTHTSSDSYQNTQASDQYPDQLDNATITVTVPFSGSAAGIRTRYALSLVSRAFELNGDWVAWCYYPARKWGPLSTATATAATHAPNRPADPSNFQPCWYLIPLTSLQQIAGRLEYGLAAADYQVIAPGSGALHPAVSGAPSYRNRCLISVAQTSSGALVLPLPYRAEQNIPSSALLTQQVSGNIAAANVTNSYTSTSMVYSSSDTVGVKVFTMGPDCGQAFTVNQATYLPGLMANVVEPGEVNVSEHGIVAPECPNIVISADTETQPGVGEYFYRGVGEFVTTRGKIYRSLPSAAFAWSNVEQFASAICGHYLNPTNKAFVRYSWYRTAYTTTAIASAASQVTTPPTISTTTPITGFTSISYKITNDLAPFYNYSDQSRFGGTPIYNPAPTNGPFLDALTGPTQIAGEVLYTDQGFLPRFPCPSFRSGTVWQNRAWVIGYDNALWFSGEIAEGEGEWFNPGFRVVIPTNEEITSISAMEGFLLIGCAQSWWYLSAGQTLPDATGTNGAVPAPLRLPFEIGCTGFTAVVKQGCLYSASSGGVWMITRSLTNEWVGQPAQDDLSLQIVGMVVAGNNVIVSPDSNYAMTWDTNLEGWARWNFLTADAPVATEFAGLLAWAEPGEVWLQTPGTWLDVNTNTPLTSYVPMGATVAPVHIAGVRSWKRTWALQLEGITYDVCNLSIGLSYTDADLIDFTYPDVALTPGELEEEVRPTKQLTSSLGMTVRDTQGATLGSGRGFALEVVSFYIGVERGLNKIAPSKRA